jgi:hypothetical protein
MGIDLTTLPELAKHTVVMLGDGSNTIKPWPDHWPNEKLDLEEFNRQWRDWVAENHPDVLQYLPDRVRDA